MSLLFKNRGTLQFDGCYSGEQSDCISSKLQVKSLKLLFFELSCSNTGGINIYLLWMYLIMFICKNLFLEYESYKFDQLKNGKSCLVIPADCIFKFI